MLEEFQNELFQYNYSTILPEWPCAINCIDEEHLIVFYFVNYPPIVWSTYRSPTLH